MLVKLLVSEGLGITWLVQVLVLLATIGRALTLRSVELHLLLVNEPSGGDQSDIHIFLFASQTLFQVRTIRGRRMGYSEKIRGGR
jgi:hypothetical protein